MVDGYAVAIAALLLAAGTAGDRVGHRRVVLAGFAVFGLASLGCALAPSIEVLIASRVVQGSGAALLLPGTMALIADAYAARQAQARALGVWAAVSSLALPAGPLLGGALVSAGSWRLVFWMNVPVVAAVIIATVRVAADGPGRHAGRFDVAGTACVALALAAAVFGIIELGHGARPAGCRCGMGDGRCRGRSGLAGRGAAAEPHPAAAPGAQPRLPRAQPIRSAITVAGIRASSARCSRIFASTTSTIDPAGLRTYFGSASDVIAVRTVFRETPINRSTRERQLS